MLRIITIIILVFTFQYGFSLTVEERLELLEKKINELEKRLEELEENKSDALFSQKETIVVEKSQELIPYKVISKKFNPLKLKENLWQRSDQIILKMLFKNNTGKEVKNISGEVVVYVDGKKAMEKRININKTLNFFKGTTIRPEEEVKMNLEFDYDSQNPLHKKVKELSVNNLTVQFFPLKIDFADGTVKYVKYRGSE